MGILVISVLIASCDQNALPPMQTEADPLPDSLKGYELYIWERDAALWMTLITGTNRHKELGEIIGTDDKFSASGGFRSTVEGLDAGLALLARLPPGETVILMPMPASDKLTQPVVYPPPPPDVVSTIIKFSRAKGIQFLEADH